MFSVQINRIREGPKGEYSTSTINNGTTSLPLTDSVGNNCGISWGQEKGNLIYLQACDPCI